MNAPPVLADNAARLEWARGVLADVPHHSDADVRKAARFVFIYAPDDDDESREGLAMLQLVMQRRRRSA